MAKDKKYYYKEFDEKLIIGANLYGEDRFEEALEFFLDMLVDYPDYVGVSMFIGAIYRELGQLDLAVDYASKATRLCPISEKSSFILHNALKDSGFGREAYAEMERYFNTPGAQPTASLYEGYLNALSQDLQLPHDQISDKKLLVRAVIEELEKLGLLENEVE